MMQVRKLIEADAEALWALRLRSLQEAPEAFLTTYDESLAPGHKERFLDGLEPESRTLFVGALLPNPAAQQLYRSLGFVSCGVVPRSAKLDEQYWDEEIMVLHL